MVCLFFLREMGKSKQKRHLFIRFLLEKVGRFRVDYTVPEGAEKCVMVFAPHTSMWDFFWGKLVMMAMDLNSKVMIKKELFFFPLGILLKKMGGIPVDRKRAMHFPKQMAEMMKETDKIALLIAPEGTRDLVKNWKKGFYYIAKAAGVPVYLSYIDYSSMRAGIGLRIDLTDDYEGDLRKIENFYRGMQGKYRGLFNLES